MEQNLLILAAKEGYVVAIEKLLNDKYVDVNTIELHYEMMRQWPKLFPVRF